MQSSGSSSVTSNSAVPTVNLANAGGGLGVTSVRSVHGSFSGIHHHHVHHNGPAASVTAGHRNGGSGNGAVVPPQALTITSMHKWSLEQLESHVNLLRENNQPISQSIALLLADARRKEEKRHAKRLANRKSACTSRARKKALIEEITKDNARLRRQALILSYLPDPVLAITADGVITFCSMQVERVLRHNISDLLGANIEELIVPNSRDAIRRLIRDLVTAEQRAVSFAEGRESGSSGGDGIENGGGNGRGGNGESEGSSGREDGRNDSGVSSSAVVISEHSSEQSFPLLEVKVRAGQSSEAVGAGEDVSDSSGDPPSKNNNGKTKMNGAAPTELSSLTHKNSSFGPESSMEEEKTSAGDAPPAKRTRFEAGTTTAKSDIQSPTNSGKTNSTESDESTSSDNKNCRKVNVNLPRNFHMKSSKDPPETVRFSHKDDVMGASVTANNADARLSSLMHYPDKDPVKKGTDSPNGNTKAAPSIRRKHVSAPRGKSNEEKQEEQSSSSAESSLTPSKDKKNPKSRSGNSSEDSGYRESNESPEESNEYAEDSSSSSASFDHFKKRGGRSRPLAPACNVCLIRDDLTTIWCELTSSIRTRSLTDMDNEMNAVPPNAPSEAVAATAQSKGTPQKNGSNNGSSTTNDSTEATMIEVEEKELLLCFRPLEEGEKVGEELRFNRNSTDNKTTDGSEEVSSSSNPKVTGTSTQSSLSNCDGAGKGGSSSNNDVTSFSENLTLTVVAAAKTTHQAGKNRPPKKRMFVGELIDNDQSNKKSCGSDEHQVQEKSNLNGTAPDEKSVVESLMLMSNHKDLR